MKNFIMLCFVLAIALAKAFSQSPPENLKIVWPEEYKWKVGSDQENTEQHMIELVPSKESVKKWTLMGTMLSLKNVQLPDIQAVSAMMFSEAKKSAPNAKMRVLERSDKWILFTIESPSFIDDSTPESQLYYAIQGKSLYINFIAVKSKELSSDFLDKWSKVFKSSEFINN